ncbi:unnamed protein product [Protopolystoma xenopodis]|uniref:Uncharacterized protein n=1 Tax=Protopolystoma xenopodis TaxID=117903 RepID=A0A448X9Q0_9PLAT|nr:unnamed protein product [Protopolystoma xenopodis]
MQASLFRAASSLASMGTRSVSTGVASGSGHGSPHPPDGQASGTSELDQPDELLLEAVARATANASVNSILSRPVWRWFPSDDAAGWPTGTVPIKRVCLSAQEQVLSDVMQEALQRHASGIDFIERNAGSSIDEHMNQEGFHASLLLSHLR